ncbi:VWA domain-containing protein [Streptomyces sp. NPDC007083]|uniref:VWA domain-containing protein n=1 Tax=Streptomyces sp. NPDC007083 TaxID=3156913 RepID=UPI0033D35D17
MTGPAISLDKIPAGLLNLTKTAAVSLEKNGIAGQRAAVHLVLDHSASMRDYYHDGSVQRLAEQALGLSANLDDDGIVPVIYFGSHAEEPFDIRLDRYTGVIEASHHRVRWGSTDYVAAMNTVVDEYRRSDATAPALVIFQTDGEPDNRRAVEQALRALSGQPIFWAFVGFGPEHYMQFLQELDELDGRAIDNASFFHAATPHAVSDSDLYDGLTREYAAWLTAATTAGIIR